MSRSRVAVRATTVLGAALLLPCLSVAPALAESPSQRECEKAGGTFERDRGEVSCSDPVGNSENSDGRSQERTRSGQGNLENKETCSGPGRSRNC